MSKTWRTSRATTRKKKLKHRRMTESQQARQRLEYLRKELRAERISYQELAELQSLAPFIDAGDVELLEAAGVPENN